MHVVHLLKPVAVLLFQLKGLAECHGMLNQSFEHLRGQGVLALMRLPVSPRLKRIGHNAPCIVNGPYAFGQRAANCGLLVFRC